ncbi:MBL fold metallo-hydrolase [Candidatus Chlorohelix sp.]|uniref:MBL fold metallo-hydrolase n=1 Tax=Candidatus Chlorohelix sp. TaxID=3139201 RepID=UPI003039FACB
MAEITWLGHNCFRLRSREATIVADPYSKRLGYDFGRPRADIVTISRHGDSYGFVEAVKGEPKVILGPGEYEINEVFITGIGSYADMEKGKLRGKNTIYVFELEGMSICHLGTLGHPLTAEHLELMSRIDILMVPIGNQGTITVNQASEIISEIEPHIVIPMHYRVEGLDAELDDISRFSKEMGIQDISPQEKLTVKPSDLPEGTKVIVLDHRNSYK